MQSLSVELNRLEMSNIRFNEYLKALAARLDGLYWLTSMDWLV